jgi:mRNA interferase MazF
MSLKYFPRAGQIFICDFSGFVTPEMTKVRPVVVISPRLPYRSEIVAIVPLSTTEPFHALPFCYRLSRNYNPAEQEDLPCWAKADMVMNLSLSRLSGFKTGRRQYVFPALDEVDLDGVRRAVLCGLGLDRPLASASDKS